MRKVAFIAFGLLVIILLAFYSSSIFTGNASLQLGSQSEGQDVLIYGVLNLEENEAIPIDSKVKIFYGGQEIFSEFLKRIVIVPYPISKKTSHVIGSSISDNVLVYTQPLQIAMVVHDVPDFLSVESGYEFLGAGSVPVGETIPSGIDEPAAVAIDIPTSGPVLVDPNLFYIEISYGGEILVTQNVVVTFSQGSGSGKVSISSPLQQFGTTVVEEDSFTKVLEDPSGISLAYITPVSLIGTEEIVFQEISQDLVVGVGEPVPFSVPFTTSPNPQRDLKFYLLPESSDVRVYSDLPVDYSIYSVSREDGAFSNILDFFNVPNEIVRNELVMYDLKEDSNYRISFTISPASLDVKNQQDSVLIEGFAKYAYTVRVEYTLEEIISLESSSEQVRRIEYVDFDNDGVLDSALIDIYLRAGENSILLESNSDSNKEISCETSCTEFGQCVVSGDVLEGFDKDIAVRGYLSRICVDCLGNSLVEKADCVVPGKALLVESSVSGNTKQLVLRDSSLNKVAVLRSSPLLDKRRIDILFQ